MAPPVVGIIGNGFLLNEEYPVHAGGVMNSAAVREVSGALPLIVPTDPALVSVEDLRSVCDGFVFTGGRANVHPNHYGEEPTEAHGTFDEARPRRPPQTSPQTTLACSARRLWQRRRRCRRRRRRGRRCRRRRCRRRRRPPDTAPNSRGRTAITSTPPSVAASVHSLRRKARDIPGELACRVGMKKTDARQLRALCEQVLAALND